MAALRLVSLMAATMAMGLVAGAFALYAHSIMPGLRRADDRTFIGAFQAIDRAIINPWFLAGSFLGALLFTMVAALTHLGRETMHWIVAALASYLVAFVITFVVNVPLNNALKAAGDPDRMPNVAAVRASFNEARWTTFNMVRVATSLLSFALLAWALVVHGRS
jgi:uncharacterized membrane protein